MTVEAGVRLLIVVVGVPLMLLLPRAMYWAEPHRPAFTLGMLIYTEGMTFSAVWSAVWTQQHHLPVQWFGAPLRAALLTLVAVPYLIGAWRYARRRRPSE